LFLILEANGFNVPELKKTKKIMDPVVAKKFDKVVVVANAAKYKDPSTDAKIMTEQWNNKMVKDLGLPVEKWVFVCCNSSVTPAKTLIDNLSSNFSDIKGFLIDSEDKTIPAFVSVFNDLGSKYKYGIVGGIRNSMPPQSKYGIVFDNFFSEVYTEGTSEYDRRFYNGISQKVDGAKCVSMNSSSIAKFWNGVVAALGVSESIVPTVCGAGDCQESLYGDDCFDERLSDKNIYNLLNGIPSGGNFAIWYGTGQQFFCEPAKTCLTYDNETACKNNHPKCSWNPDKLNPSKKLGVCASIPGDWGCATTW
jgi:hypothetical protein